MYVYKNTKNGAVITVPSPVKGKYWEPAGEDKEEPELTNKEIKAILDERGIEYKPNANKATLLELLTEVEKEDKEEPEDEDGKADS